MLSHALKEVRQSLKNSRLLIVDEIWSLNESDKKNIINTLKDEKVMQVLRIDPTHDDFLVQILNPAKYKPNIPALQ